MVLPQSQLDATEPGGARGSHVVIWHKRAWIADKNRWAETVVVSNGKQAIQPQASW